MSAAVPPQREALVARLRPHVGALCGFGVRSLSLFGSFARDEARPDSDVDVLVDFAAPPTFRQYMGLKLFLEDLFGRPVDVVTRAGLQPRMLAEVEREAVGIA